MLVNKTIFEAGRFEEPQITLPAPSGSQKKQKNSRKSSISASLTMLKALTLWITANCVENSSRDGNTRTNYQPPEKPVCRQAKKQQLKPDMQ